MNGERTNGQMLTITDLVNKGWSKELLYRIAHMAQTPFFRTSKRGHFYVFEDKLIEFVSTRRVGK